MSVSRTLLAAAALLGTLGLAGCQTTEESVYYSSAPTVRETIVYSDGPRWRYSRPPVVYVRPPPRYYGGPTPLPPRHPPRWTDPRRPPVMTSPGNPRQVQPRPPRRAPSPYTNGPTPDPRYYRTN